MSVTTLSELERGEGNQRRDTLQRVATALGRSVEDLYALLASMRSEALPQTSRKLSAFEAELLERWDLLKPETRASFQRAIWELTDDALKLQHAKQTA